MRAPRWVAVRKDSSEPGVHTVVTDDLYELHRVLSAATQRFGSGMARLPGELHC